MKNVLIAFVVGLTSLQALAEGPILSCRAYRDGPRSDGRPGYEKIDEKSFLVPIAPRMKATELMGATVKTHLTATGVYNLVLIDKDLKASSTSQGTLHNRNIDLSLSGQGFSTYVTCEIL